MLHARRRGSSIRLTAALTAAIVLAACANAQASGGQTVRRPSPAASSTPPAPAHAANQLLAPAPLFDPGLDLRAGPVPVPLELQIPALRISAPVLGVGLTPKNVMDAPMGRANDPVWQRAFWYRGGGIPGDPSTTTIAGHVDDVLGRPALFARLMDLRPGDSIVVRDTRTGVDDDYVVTATVTYTLKQTVDPAVLAQIYGLGPVSGQGPLPSPDGLSHLTLITCTGNWLNRMGTFDHRVAVYAIALPSRPPAHGARS